MKLKTKFTLAIGTVLVASYGLLMLYTSTLQNRLVIGQAEQQARMLYKQVLLTRQWVADHQGLFFLHTDDTAPNPFLQEPVIHTDKGLTLVKHNPAMVTRELSEYAAEAGYSWFRVTSLRPVNPKNIPDPFERDSLLLFEQGIAEQSTITTNEHGKVLRYSAPLEVRQSCLSCHAVHGYNIGDIRGALTITVPINWADRAISKNNRSIFLFGLLSVIAVIGVMYLLFNTLVAHPIHLLTNAMEKFPKHDLASLPLPRSNDEICNLTKGFEGLCQRLESSTSALDTASEKGFRAEKLAALGQLTAGIAHEINNPLGGMLNCVKSMAAEPDNQELQARYLPLLEKGLHRIENTMRQLLNYGRVEPLQLHRVDIDGVIRDCITLLEYRLRNISTRLDLNLDNIYCIDQEAVKQIVMNIVLNALQAMPEKGSLTIKSQQIGQEINLIFQDTGIGIAKENIDHIFDPFFTTKEVGEGTGLGLAVTLSMIQRLDGNIEVESQMDKGSTFILTLPVNVRCLQNNEPTIT